MDTGTKTPQGARATDRIIDALLTLAALLDRTINQAKSLDSDFQERLLQAVHETEACLQNQAAQHLETGLAETRNKFEEQFRNKVAEISAEWEAERTRLNTEVNRLTQATAQWEAERSRLTGEIERLARVEAATQAEAETAITPSKGAASAAASQASATTRVEALTQEMERVEGLIKEISALVEDPRSRHQWPFGP